MKYFVKLKLKKSTLAEVVYANGSLDAIAIAEAKSKELIEKWNETIEEKSVESFLNLGVRACACDPSITFNKGDYYYCGRKVNNDMNFDIGFSKEYTRIEKITKLIEEQEEHY